MEISSFNNSTNDSETNLINLSSTLKCSSLNIIGVFFLIMFMISLIQNSFLMFSFYSNERTLSSHQKFLIALTILNYLGTLFQYPIAFINYLNCKLVFLFDNKNKNYFLN